MLTDYPLMRRLESEGLSFARVLGAKRFAPVAAIIGRDLHQLYKQDPRAGVGMRFSHRVFDARWLTDRSNRFELIAVLNRMDRQAFEPTHCGEIRLVYRLAYTRKVADELVDSRLPMTVNVVFWQPAPNDAAPIKCRAVARRWQQGWTPVALKSLALKSVEVNLQSIRWPSTLHPSLAGHAEYVLRVFTPDKSGKLRPSGLEMTPDVERIQRNPALKRQLLRWLADPVVQKAIDDGVAVLPDKFLARRAVSVTPRGLARPQNRPWKALLSPAVAAKYVPKDGRYVKSGVGLLRRLDTSTCQGCHQSRSVAGFHLVGQDDPSKDVDRLQVAISPHFADDLTRREQFSKAVLAGRPADRRRGLSERSVPSRVGRRGDRCGLSGPKGAAVDASFTAWTCGPGLTCSAHDETELGVCTATTVSIGDACQVGLVAGRPRGVDDRVRGVRNLACGPGQFCESNRVGFPGGMCTAVCDEDATSKAGAPVCGGIPRLTPFNRCIARGRPFTECILNNVSPKLLAYCDQSAPCRDDYICAATPEGPGACLPPYFLFQLRVDGH